MISDLIQLFEAIQSIKGRIDKILWNREQCLYLLERVEILEEALKPLDNISELEKQIYAKAFEKLHSVLTRVEQYIKNCENWYKFIRNTVFANQHSEEITFLDKQIADAAATLNVALSSRNAEHIGTLLREISNMSKIQQAIYEDTQTLQQANHLIEKDFEPLDSPTPNISQLIPNVTLSPEENQILSKTLIDYRKAINNQAAIVEPLSYNPSRDILLATEAGKRLTADEKAQVYAFLRDGETQKLRELFEKKNLECNTNIEQEIQNYFKRYYTGRDSRMNLATLLERAITQAADTSIHKYLKYSENFFIGKILSFHNKKNNAPTEHTKLEHIDAEVIDCKKTQKDIELLLRDPLGQRFKMHISIWTNALNLKIFALETREFGRYIRHLPQDTLEIPKTIISLKPKAQNIDHYFVPGNYELTDSKKGGWLRGESAEGFKLINQKYPYNQYLIHPKEYDVDIIAINHPSEQPQKKKSVLTHNLNQYIVEYPEIMLGSEERGVSLDLDSVQIKDKEIDRSEIKRKKQTEIECLKKEIVSELSQENNLIYVDEILDIWIAHTTQRVLSNNLVEQWLLKTPVNILEKINKCILFLKEIQDDGTTLDINQFILNLVLEANCSRLFKARQDSLYAVSMIQRLTIACEYLDKLKNKDLIFFIGNTGAGKSTAINYFTGVPLRIDNTGPIRTIKIDETSTDYQAQSVAKIGAFIGSSETTFVRGFPVQNSLQEYWDNPENIDFENLMLCDCPGFNDTRGMGYDLSAALSISRAIKDARSVKAVVLVIPYRDFFSAKGKAVIDAFEQLEEMFVEKFDSWNNYKIKRSLRLVISHSNEPNKEQNSFESLIAQFCSEKNETNTTNEIILKRERIWKFIRALCQEKKVLFINVESIDKQAWLSPCATQKFNYNHEDTNLIEQNQFTEVLDRGTNQRAFADSIHSSLYIWGTLVLQRYFEEIPQKILEVQDSIQIKEKDILRLDIENRELNLTIQGATERKSILEEKHAMLIEIRDSTDFDFNSKKNDLLEELREKTRQLNNAEIQRKKIEQKNVENAITEKTSLQNDQGIKIKAKKEELTKLQEKIQAHTTKKKELSTGRANEKLCASHNYMPGETLKLHTLKDGRLKMIHDEVRPIKPDDIASTKEHIVEQFSDTTLSYAYIKKDYRIIPENDKREEFYQKQSVAAKNGQYVATFKGEGAKLSADPQYAPKGSADGKSIVYTFELTWESGKPFPWYSIEHTLPKIDINEQAILNEDSEITRKTADAHSKQAEITELQLTDTGYTTTLLDLNKQKYELTKDIEKLQNREMRNNIPELIKTYENMIDSQASEIKNTINKVTKNIQTIEQNQKELPIKQAEKNKLLADKIRLAVIIRTSLNIMHCLRNFAEQALDASTDIAQSIKRRDDISEGSLGTLREECKSYINNYDIKRANFIAQTSQDFIQSLLDLQQKNNELTPPQIPISLEISTTNSELSDYHTALNDILEIEHLQVLHQQKLLEALEKNWALIAKIFEGSQSELESTIVENGTPIAALADEDEISKQTSELETLALKYGCEFHHTLVTEEGNYFFNALAIQLGHISNDIQTQELKAIRQKIAVALTNNWLFYKDYMAYHKQASIAGQEILLAIAHALNSIIIIVNFEGEPKIIRPIDAVNSIFLSYDTTGHFHPLLPIKDNQEFQNLEQIIETTTCLNNEFLLPKLIDTLPPIKSQQAPLTSKRGWSPAVFQKNLNDSNSSSSRNSPILENWHDALDLDTDNNENHSSYTYS